MAWISSLIPTIFMGFFQDLYQQLIQTILKELGNLMTIAADCLELPLVKNGMLYSQILASTIIVPKAAKEIWQTYILFQEGDPDADISNAVVRSIQAAALVWCVPFIVKYTFLFGTKLTADVAQLSAFDGNTAYSKYSLYVATASGWLVPAIACITIVLIIVVFLQTVLRSADLAGTAVIGSIMAANITNVSHSAWTAWFRQLVIICCAQALQIFFLAGAFQNPFSEAKGMLLSLGWVVASVKAPKYLQQFAYATGLGGVAAGAAKQSGSMVAMRLLLRK